MKQMVEKNLGYAHDQLCHNNYPKECFPIVFERLIRVFLSLRLAGYSDFLKAENRVTNWLPVCEFRQRCSGMTGLSCIREICGENRDFVEVDFIGDNGVTKAPIPQEILEAEELMPGGKVLCMPFSFVGPLRTIAKFNLWARYVIPLGAFRQSVNGVEFNPSKINEWGVA
jgi:hypothetical protein